MINLNKFKLNQKRKKRSKGKGVVIVPPKLKMEAPAHIHSWQLVAKTYASPRTGVHGSGNIDERVVEKALLGVTTLLWECECGETKKEEMLGTDEDKLEEIIDKAGKMGPQQIVRGEDIYVVAKWTPPSSREGLTSIRQ